MAMMTTSVTRDPYEQARYAIGQICKRVGCSEPLAAGYDPIRLERVVCHGPSRWTIEMRVDGSEWDALNTWLGELHAPLITERQAEQRRARLEDEWPDRLVHPLVGG